jgi:nucleoside phosphorylase
MKTPKEAFLEQFDPALVPHITEFGKRLSEIDCDVFVLMARKAACFVEALSRLGMANIRAIVTTDRVLDCDRSWLAGKRVAIIDEALISGTTLYRTQQRLEEAGVAHQEIHVFCVNTRWWTPAVIEPMQPFLKLDDKRTTSFCADIVDAISVLPLPYAVDYPYLADIRLRLADGEQLWSATNWNAHDVSSTLQRGYGISTCTLIPDDPVVRALDRDLGWSVSANAEILKIRAYTRTDMRTDRELLWCHFVPMVVFRPFSAAEIHELWTQLIAFHAADADLLTRTFITPASRLRVLQYVVAMRLWRQYCRGLTLDDERFERAHPSPQSIRNVFPPVAMDAVARACAVSAPVLRGVEIAPPDATDDGPRADPADATALAVAQRRLTEPFLQMYFEREIPAREAVLEHGRAVFDMPEETAPISRLRGGVELRDLRRRLDGVIDREEQRTVVSIFLDHAVDHGIIVPVTREDGGIYFRAYRHGEDVLWGVNEERHAYALVEAFLDAAKRTEVPRLWLEKLLVLLIRIGVQQSFLRRYNRTLGDDGTVGVRYALKGAVVKVHQPKLYGAEFDSALSRVLVEAGTLVEDKAGRYRLGVRPPEEAPTKDPADRHAVLIGSLFGQLHAGVAAGVDGTAVRLTDQELIILATCLQPNDVAAAIAAEIALFVEAWRPRARAMRAKTMTPARAGELLHYLRRPAIQEALTSADWKYQSSLRSMSWTIIDRVATSLADRVYAQTWRSFWSETGEQAEAITPTVRDLLRREGTWVARANVLFRALQLALAVIEDPASGDVTSILDALEALLERTKPADRARLDAARISERLDDGSFRADVLRLHAANELDKLAYEGTALLDVVDTSVAAFGQTISSTAFPHAMFIMAEPRSATHGRQWDLIEKAVHAIRARAFKHQKAAQQARIKVLPDQPGFEHGRWVCATGPLARVWLIRLATEIHERLSRSCDVRIVLFAHLLPDEMLHVRDKTTRFVGANFWTRAVSLFSRPDAEDLFRYGLVTVTPFLAGEGPALRRDVIAERLFTHANASTLEDDTPTPVRFKVDQFTMRARQPVRVAPRRGVDVGIITIVSEEMRAVRDALERQGGYTKGNGRRSAHLFYRGQLKSENGTHGVVATQQVLQGNRSVILAYNALRSECSPLLVVLLGIGGGIHPSLGLADVAIADRIYYYDERKETEHGTNRRLSPGEVPAWLVSYLNDFFVDGDPAVLPGVSGAPKDTFKVKMGPIGTGDAVIGYRNAETRNYLRTVNDKTLVVETEAGGIARAMYEEQLEFNARTKGYLVLRGISDHADEEKDDRYRYPAAAHAMLALEKLLARLPTLGTWPLLEKL